MITRRQLLQWIASLGVLGAATAAYAFIVEPMWRTRVTRYDLTPKRWPKGLNLKIAALADIHACHPWMPPERIRTIVESTNALGADMIVLLGDYVTGHRYVTQPVPSAEWAKELAALRAPLGVHAILGNHEWWDDRTAQRAGVGPTVGQQALEAVGIPVLQNDAVRSKRTAGRSGWSASRISLRSCRRGIAIPAAASASTISPDRSPRSPTTVR